MGSSPQVRVTTWKKHETTTYSFSAWHHNVTGILVSINMFTSLLEFSFHHSPVDPQQPMEKSRFKKHIKMEGTKTGRGFPPWQQQGGVLNQPITSMGLVYLPTFTM